MRFHLLGAVTAHHDGVSVDLGPAKQRLVLAALATSPGQAVPFDVLVDRVWGTMPPANVRTAVYSYVARLRRALRGGTEIVHEHGGYTLTADVQQVDLAQFRQLVGSGPRATDDPITRARELRAALAIWRGVPLADLNGDWVERLRATVNQQRLTALVEIGEAELNSGHLDEVTNDLVSWVDEYPLSERLVALLIQAYVRAGRRAEALDLYARTREYFVDQLGEEPGVELQRLHERVLRRDTALETPWQQVRTANRTWSPPLPPRQLPRANSTFVGRATEVETIIRALHAGVAGAAATVAIYGPGGVGKSALAVQAAHGVADQFPDGQLYVDLRGATPGVSPLTPIDVLGRFLRALGLPPSEVPEDLDEAAALFRSMTANARVLVMLDNAVDARHVVDLMPSGQGCAALVTSRVALATLDDAVHLPLDCLTPETSALLLRSLDPTSRCHDHPTITAELARLCGNLPLALRIVSARIASRPGWPLARFVERLSDRRTRLDELGHADLSIRACFDLTYRALVESDDELDREAARAFRLLGICDGPDMPATIAPRLLDRTPAETEAAVTRLLDAQLVQAPTAERYRMHDLVRDYAHDVAERDESPTERRAALERAWHCWAATAQHAIIHVNPQTWAAEADLPKDQALELPDLPSALQWLDDERANLIAAAEQALADAEHHGQAAVHLTLGLGLFLLVRSEPETLLSLVSRALTIATVGGDDVATARLLHLRGRAAMARTRLDEAVTALTESLRFFDRAGDRRRSLLARVNLAMCHTHLGAASVASGLLHEAVTHARDLGDRSAAARALQALAIAQSRLGELPDAMASAREALAIDTAEGNLRAQSFDLRTLGKIQMAGGDAEAARESFTAELAAARETSEHSSIARALSELATAYAQIGDLDSARAALAEAMPLFEGTRDQNDWSYAMSELSNVLRLQGDHAGAVDCAESALALDQGRIPEYEARAMWRLGQALHASGDTGRSIWFLTEAHRRFAALGCYEAADVSRLLDEVAGNGPPMPPTSLMRR